VTSVPFREKVIEIYSATTYTVSTFAINPARSELFPWLAPIAAAWEQYRFKQFQLHYTPFAAQAIMSGTEMTAGIVCMSVMYDVADDNPHSIIEQARTITEKWFKPSESRSVNFVGPGQLDAQKNYYTLADSEALADTDDPHEYFPGKVVIGVDACPVGGKLIGCIEVSGVVELIRPRDHVAGASTISSHWRLTGVASATPLGNVANPTPEPNSSDFFYIVAAANSIMVRKNTPPGSVFFLFYGVGSNSTATTMPSFAAGAGLTELDMFKNDTVATFTVPANATVNNGGSKAYMFQVSPLGLSQDVAIELGSTTAAIYGTVTSCDLFIASFNSTIVTSMQKKKLLKNKMDLAILDTIKTLPDDEEEFREYLEFVKWKQNKKKLDIDFSLGDSDVAGSC
jgi:hypothetical protein